MDFFGKLYTIPIVKQIYKNIQGNYIKFLRMVIRAAVSSIYCQARTWQRRTIGLFRVLAVGM